MAAPQESGLDHVVSADGTVIALEQVTDGPQPLVTVPGGTAARAVWGDAARALDGRFAVWLADRRGKGDSGDTPPYSFDREYEDLHAIADRFSGRAVFAAHSSGAVCLLGAAARGLPAASLVVYEPPWPLPGRDDPIEALDAIDARIAAGDREGALEIALRRLVQVSPAAIEGMRQAPSWPVRVAQVHTFTREGRELERVPEGTDALRAIGLRTVLLSGEQSAEHLRRSTSAVAEAVPDSEVVELPGQGHTALQAAPSLVAEAILAHVPG